MNIAFNLNGTYLTRADTNYLRANMTEEVIGTIIYDNSWELPLKVKISYDVYTEIIDVVNDDFTLPKLSTGVFGFNMVVMDKNHQSMNLFQPIGLPAKEIGGGKVDDVQVDGKSVITDKVAKIDLTPYQKKDPFLTLNEEKGTLTDEQFNSLKNNHDMYIVHNEAKYYFASQEIDEDGTILIIYTVSPGSVLNLNAIFGFTGAYSTLTLLTLTILNKEYTFTQSQYIDNDGGYVLNTLPSTIQKTEHIFPAIGFSSIFYSELTYKQDTYLCYSTNGTDTTYWASITNDGNGKVNIKIISIKENENDYSVSEPTIYTVLTANEYENLVKETVTDVKFDTNGNVVLMHDSTQITNQTPLSLGEMKGPITVVNIEATPQATNGTITDAQLATLQKSNMNMIMFNHEVFTLMDKGHTEGFLTYSHVGIENDLIYIKTFTITVSTLAWVLNIRPVPKMEYNESTKTLNIVG